MKKIHDIDVEYKGTTPQTSDAEDVLAWEEISAGRYMPRRIRGSLRGRVLG